MTTIMMMMRTLAVVAAFPGLGRERGVDWLLPSSREDFVQGRERAMRLFVP